jgi:hypothetical protein
MPQGPHSAGAGARHLIVATLAAGATLAACTGSAESSAPATPPDDALARQIADDWTAAIRNGRREGMRHLIEQSKWQYGDEIREMFRVDDRVELRTSRQVFCIGEYIDPDFGMAVRRGPCR